MSITTLEQANEVVSRAVSVLNKHDALLKEISGLRATYEIAQVHPPTQFNIRELKQELDKALGEMPRLKDHLTTLSGHSDFDSFRRAVTKASHWSGILSVFEEAIASKELYLNIYKESGVGPQTLEEGETFEADVEAEKLANIRVQKEEAIRQYISLAETIDLGELVPEKKPSVIIGAGE